MLIRNLPLFPLQVVLFPGMVLPLHIFEERYRLMIAQCLDDEARFGVVCIREGREVGDHAKVHDVGTIARIVRVQRYDDGRMDLLTLGVERVRITSLNSDLPYLRGEVSTLHDAAADPAQVSAAAAVAVLLLEEYRDLLGLADAGLELPTDPEAISFVVGLLDVGLARKQELLETDSTVARLNGLSDYLEREVALVKALGPTRRFRGNSGPTDN
ncbi:MAG: LON peptidase substrate-binding domain-containing protein [Chloroflexia bacterium]